MPSRLPVREHRLHVAVAVAGTLDEHRRVADRLLLLVDRADLLVHAFGADLHVADRVVAQGLGMLLPDLDAVRHQLAHRRLIVVVADDTAGDAGAPAAMAVLSTTRMSAPLHRARAPSGRGPSGRRC